MDAANGGQTSSDRPRYGWARQLADAAVRAASVGPASVGPGAAGAEQFAVRGVRDGYARSTGGVPGRLPGVRGTRRAAHRVPDRPAGRHDVRSARCRSGRVPDRCARRVARHAGRAPFRTEKSPRLSAAVQR